MNEINWSDIETRIQNGNASVSKLAKELSIKPELLRKELVAKYGTAVQFVRGRNGGIKLSR